MLSESVLCCNTHICHSPRILAWRKSVIRRDECLRQMTTGAMNQNMLHTYSSDPVCLVCQLCHEWGCGLHKNLHEHPIPVFCPKKKLLRNKKPFLFWSVISVLRTPRTFVFLNFCKEKTHNRNVSGVHGVLGMLGVSGVPESC